MEQKNKASNCKKCQITIQTADGNKTVVATQKRKEQARQTLYLNRI